MSYNSRTADKFVLRLPEGLRDRVADKASACRRSMNSHFLHLIELGLAVEEGASPVASGAQSHDLATKLIEQLRTELRAEYGQP